MKLFLLIVVLLGSQVGHTKLVVNTGLSVACDPIWRPPGCVPPNDDVLPADFRAQVQGRMDYKRDLNDTLGVNLVDTDGSFSPPRFRRGIFTINDSGLATVENETETSDPGEGAVDDTIQQAAAPVGPLGGPQGAGQQPGGVGGPAATPPPATQVGGGGPEVREGLIFASEEPEAITPPKANTRNVTADFPKSPSAVDLNKDNDAGSDNAGSAIAGAGFGGGGAAGQVGPKGESGPGVAGKKPRGDSFLDNLAKIAKNMGRRFFGASGPGLNGQGQGGTKFAYGGKGKKGSGTQMASANTDGLDLKGAYGSRMPASNFEFNGASMWMYGNMCDHWKELSKQDRIPRNYAKCPQ